MRPAMLLRCAVLVLALGACTTKQVVIPNANNVASSVAPALIVERFLAAANSSDINTMAELFGTKDGPVSKLWEQDRREKQMFVIASILRHNDYNIEGEQLVPGRQQEAVQLNVLMTVGERKTIVPFIMVRTSGASWLIEQIDLEKLTYPR